MTKEHMEEICLKCGQHNINTAGGRWRQLCRTELDAEEWSVAYVSSEATMLKSNKFR